MEIRLAQDDEQVNLKKYSKNVVLDSRRAPRSPMLKSGLDYTCVLSSIQNLI